MKPYYFDGIHLPDFMDWDMMGAFVKTKTGNQYLYPGQWVVADDDVYRIMSTNEVTNLNLKNMSTAEPNVQELSFGQKAVGITFNPGGNPLVNEIKQKAAEYIDVLQQVKSTSENGEVKRMLSIAITEAQSSQMWAVKGATWQY